MVIIIIIIIIIIMKMMIKMTVMMMMVIIIITTITTSVKRVDLSPTCHCHGRRCVPSLRGSGDAKSPSFRTHAALKRAKFVRHPCRINMRLARTLVHSRGVSVERR